VGILTLDRPEVRNAFDFATLRELTAVLDALDADDDVRVVILTGAGDQAFCSGVDLKEVATDESIWQPGHLEYADVYRIFYRMYSKPLIAAVNGVALGGGFELALSCDIIVASENAVFGFPEVTLGMFPDAGGAMRLPNYIPPVVAFQLVLSGDRINAETAFRLGLVSMVVPPDQLLPEAITLAERISRNSPSALRLAKRLMLETLNLPEADAWERTSRYRQQLVQTADVEEGPRAWAQKREPAWRTGQGNTPGTEES
jgi:crotonobetainyl-CoA hydratase